MDDTTDIGTGAITTDIITARGTIGTGLGSSSAGAPGIIAIGSRCYRARVLASPEFGLTIWDSDFLKDDYNTAGFTNKTALNGPFLQTGVNF